MQKNTKGKGKANNGHDHDEWEDIDIDMLSDHTDTDDMVDDGWISSDTTGSHSNGEGPLTQPRTHSKSRLASQSDGDSTAGKSLGKMMDGMDSNPGDVYKSLKIGPTKGQKWLPNTKSLRIENKAMDTQIDGVKCRPKDETKSCSVVEGGKFLNFETTDLSGTQHPHKKETLVSNDGTKSTRAIKPNFQGKEMQLPDTSAADVVGVQQSGRGHQSSQMMVFLHQPSFGDVPGLDPSGSLVQDLALVYLPLWTSWTQIHTQMRAIVPSPETWCVGVGEIGWWWAMVLQKPVIFAIDQMKTRPHTEIGWSCGMEGYRVAGACCGGHSGGGGEGQHREC
ncbi:hypothetical protein EDC04DRAFT_2608157 [Pisolithus marmoratus]|nr:hypothetical protein EDC04DRAFT_2608157 [Pisolithus marmoratus]